MIKHDLTMTSLRYAVQCLKVHSRLLYCNLSFELHHMPNNHQRHTQLYAYIQKNILIVIPVINDNGCRFRYSLAKEVMQKWRIKKFTQESDRQLQHITENGRHTLTA